MRKLLLHLTHLVLGITAINSTTNAAFKLSINGSKQQYGIGNGTGATTAVVVSPTIFLQNTTATTGKMYDVSPGFS
jgi:hypothetical protein